MLRKISVSDGIVTLFLSWIAAAEISHLYGVFMHKSLSDCILLFWPLAFLGLIATVVISLLSDYKNRRSEAVRLSGSEWLLLAVFLFGFVMHIVFVCLRMSCYRTGDMTLETVGTFLHTNEIYSVNPMTGLPYEVGLPTRVKILCLPTLYAILCKTFGIAPSDMVLLAAPIATIVFCYSAYVCVAKSLFEDDRRKRLVFLLVVSALLWIGSYAFGMDGFGLLYAGWRGVVIRNTILIPYAVSACLRKKYIRAVMCVAAEACIVWTLYGLGACAIVVVGLCAAKLLEPIHSVRREAE